MTKEVIECDNNHDCEHCDWTECPLEVEKKNRRREQMNKRTDEEVQAYVDGYNACYDRFVETLMQRGSVTKAIEKMGIFKEATNSVLLSENVGTCQQKERKKNEQIY